MSPPHQISPFPPNRLQLARGALALTLLAWLATSAAFAQQGPAKVETVVVAEAEGVTRELSLTGTVNTMRRAELSSRTSGLVADLQVDAGSEVKKGDVLLTLDTDLARIALESVQAELEQAQIELEDADRKVEEVRELAASGGFSKSEQDTRKASASIAKVNVKRLEARLRQQEEIIARHELLAPFDGVIYTKHTEAGEWVDTGDAVLELVEITNLRFDLQVPQEYYAVLQNAGDIQIILDAFPRERFAAQVDVQVPVRDPVSRTFLTRLTVEDPKGVMTPGMSGRALIRAQMKGEAGLMVPRDAVMRYPDGSAKVWVVTQSGDQSVVQAREVQTAGLLGERAQILSGLKGGETIVLRGNESLQEGQAVQAVPSPTSKPSTSTSS